MSRILTLFSLYLLVSGLLLVGGAAANPSGFTLTLIHPESPTSPLFQTNFTYEERIQRLVFQSDVRDHYLSSNPELVRPHVDLQSYYFHMVKIGIGTFKILNPQTTTYKSYYLYMDTGSDLLWLQCEGCRAPGGICFNQREPFFPNSISSSYNPLPCNQHKLCTPNQCNGKVCSYYIWYSDNTSSSGILAQETFTFSSNNRQMEMIKGLVFGCGGVNKKSYGDSTNQIAGIMGLGWGSHSIINQIYSQSNGRFSYCLPVVNKYTSQWPRTFLRFGADIVQRRNLRIITPLLQNKDRKPYYLYLQGISMNAQRLNVSEQAFRLRSDGTGGCIIDSGTPFSRIVTPAYTILKASLEKYFSGFRNLKNYEGPQGLDLCYERKKPEGFKNLPRITFHLQNADLVVAAEGLFVVMDKIGLAKGEYFCLAMRPTDGVTVIGAYQQTNQRFIYDTKQHQLLFSTEDCSKDA